MKFKEIEEKKFDELKRSSRELTVDDVLLLFRHLSKKQKERAALRYIYNLTTGGVSALEIIDELNN